MDEDVWIVLIVMAGVLIFVRMITSTVQHSIRSYHENKQHWGRTPKGVPPMFQKMTDKAMEERDEVIQSLRERIEVLEKIVTDQHKQSRSSKLSEEIDKLNG